MKAEGSKDRSPCEPDPGLSLSSEHLHRRLKKEFVPCFDRGIS